MIELPVCDDNDIDFLITHHVSQDPFADAGNSAFADSGCDDLRDLTCR